MVTLPEAEEMVIMAAAVTLAAGEKAMLPAEEMKAVAAKNSPEMSRQI